jgi:hypothetical protein
MKKSKKKTEGDNTIILKGIDFSKIKKDIINNPSNTVIDTSSKVVENIPIISNATSILSINNSNIENKKRKTTKAKQTPINLDNETDILTSSLEKLGISNKEILPFETFYKNPTIHVKMLISGKNISKDSNCWWCRYKIPDEWHPLGLPVKIEYTNKADINCPKIFHCDGIFCSFNCMMAYSRDNSHCFKYKQCGTYITLLYREIYGKECWITKIESAPSWKLLKDYGGSLTIQEFRNSLNKISLIECEQFETLPFIQQPVQTFHFIK